jgi:hypothetical protein
MEEKYEREKPKVWVPHLFNFSPREKKEERSDHLFGFYVFAHIFVVVLCK